jgi:hypothetical protein
MLSVEMLPAERGDALLIEYGSGAEPTHRVVVDGGPVNSGIYEGIRERLDAVPVSDDGRRRFSLLVVTHVDTDHIEGVIRLLQDAELRAVFDDVWYNGWRHLVEIDQRSAVAVLGGLQGEFLGALLQAQGRPWNQLLGGGPVFVPDDGPIPAVTLPGGLVLTLLSPDRDALERLRKPWRRHVEDSGFVAGDSAAVLEALRGEWWARPRTLGEVEASADSSAANRSSIAVLAEYGGRSILLAGDAHDDVLTSSLQRLRAERGLAGPLPIDALKLSHHGSRHNTTRQLLAELVVGHYLVSTDGSRFRHPDAATISTILAAHQGSARPVLACNLDQERYRALESDPRMTLRIGPAAKLTFETT